MKGGELPHDRAVKFPPLTRPLAQVQSEARPTPSTDLPTRRLHATSSRGPSSGRGQGVRPNVDTRRPPLQNPISPRLGPMFVSLAVAKMGTLRRGQVGGELTCQRPPVTSMPPRRPSLRDGAGRGMLLRGPAPTQSRGIATLYTRLIAWGGLRWCLVTGHIITNNPRHPQV